MQRNVDVAVIGAGSAGLAALKQVAAATDSYVLIDGGELGTTCARVGCMPSKAIIQIADDYARRHLFARLGIDGAAGVRLDVAEALEHVRDLRDIFVDRVLAGTIDELGERFLPERAHILGPDSIRAGAATIRAKRMVIATGSRPIVPEAWRHLGDRIVTTDGFFEQESLPDAMAVVGLGGVGLELGQALYRMGCEITGFDRLPTPGGVTDPAVASCTAEVIGREFPLHLGAAVTLSARDGRIEVRSDEHGVVVDKVLASLGRRPNIDGIGLENLGVALDASGVPVFDPHTMQVGELPVFIAGDVTASRAILHEAVFEGRVAGFNAVQPRPIAFARKTPLSITFTDPNLCAVGARLAELPADATVVGEVRLGSLGRALIMGRNRGVLRLYVDAGSGRLRGGALLAPDGEHVAHLLAWCIERRLGVVDLLRLPYYHPTLEEALQAAARDALAKLGTQPPHPADLEPLASTTGA